MSIWQTYKGRSAVHLHGNTAADDVWNLHILPDPNMQTCMCLPMASMRAHRCDFNFEGIAISHLRDQKILQRGQMLFAVFRLASQHILLCVLHMPADLTQYQLAGLLCLVEWSAGQVNLQPQRQLVH